MGDEADDLYERALESYDGTDAHGEKTCERCGEKGLQWEHQDANPKRPHEPVGRWVLVTLGGKVHRCGPTDRRNSATRDFKQFKEKR